MFWLVSYAHADNSIGASTSDVDISITPDNPAPYEDVTISLSSYLVDLNKAMIAWSDGKNTLLEGYGKTSYGFKASGPNTITTITITITPSDGSSPITKNVVINPSEVELLWEGVNSYTPPFYRGKAFVSEEGKIRVVAIPDTNIIKTGKGNITYTWQNNGQVVDELSGYGKDSYTFNNNPLNESEDIGVTAGSVDGRYNAVGSITVPIVLPQLIFYEKSPSQGILFNQALTDSFNVPGDQATIVAVPYYLAIKGNGAAFTYHWQINQGDIDTPAKKTELTIHPTSHGGYATIDLTLENFNTLFQKVSGELKLNL